MSVDDCEILFFHLSKFEQSAHCFERVGIFCNNKKSGGVHVEAMGGVGIAVSLSGNVGYAVGFDASRHAEHARRLVDNPQPSVFVDGSTLADGFSFVGI